MKENHAEAKKKDLFYLIRTESDRPLKRIAVMAAVAALGSTGSLAIINAASQNPQANDINFRHVIMFLSVVGIFAVSFGYILIQCIHMVEDILHKIRLRLSDKIRRTDLQNIEAIGKSTIYNRMTQELSMISQMSIYLIQAMQSAVLLVCVTIYVGWLSKIAVILVVSTVGIGFLALMKKDKIIMSKLKESDQADIQYFTSLTDIIDGLKEIKLSRKKGVDIFDSFEDISENARGIKISTNYLFAQNMVFAQAYVFLVLGVIVFVLPQFKESFIQEILSTTTAMLFAIGPLSSLIATLPYYEKVNLCVRNIYALETELNYQMNPDEVVTADDKNRFMEFKQIRMDGIYFDYMKQDNKDPFGIGPMDVTIHKGEVLFVVGGNGSGKTTFLKALTTLYKAQSGNIFVDDERVDDVNFHEYRELFSAIFYDFHLFHKLYGLMQINRKKVEDLLKLMEIDHKTELTENGFSTINLSTGQRKRLALIVSFLEDRPIYIFDEWAADQDPAFKDYFYYDLLTKLKNEGKTVIAVSHDDRYFHLADRVIKLEFGKIVNHKSMS